MNNNTFTSKHQNVQPGKESAMRPQPKYDNPEYKASGKLKNKTAIISGGDSGIGRAAAIAFAKEGANVVIMYLNENSDATETAKIVTGIGARCMLLSVDLRDENAAFNAVEKVKAEFSKVDILVNNAGVQYPKGSILDIDREQLFATFETNMFAMFYLTKACLPLMEKGSSIINTTSVTAFKGNDQLIDYSASKGAIVSYTRSLSLSLEAKGIRVNAVSPGPVWTPLIVSSFNDDHIAEFGKDTPMERYAEPYELAPAYVFLASNDSSNISGQVIHINSGDIV